MIMSDLPVATVIFAGISMGFLTIFGTIANICVLTILCRKQWRKKSSYTLVINLAVSDCVLCAIGVPTELVILTLNHYNIGVGEYCSVNTFITVWLSLHTMATLAAIAVERLHGIVRVFKHKQRLWISRIAILISWTTSCPIAVYFTWDRRSSVFFQRCRQKFDSLNTEQFTGSKETVVAFGVLCLIIIAVCYFGIFKHVKLHRNQIRSSSTAPMMMTSVRNITNPELHENVLSKDYSEEDDKVFEQFLHKYWPNVSAEEIKKQLCDPINVSLKTRVIKVAEQSTERPSSSVMSQDGIFEKATVPSGSKQTMCPGIASQVSHIENTRILTDTKQKNL